MPTPDAIAELVAHALPQFHTWAGRPDAAVLASLPGSPAVLLFIDGGGAPVQLLTTQQLKRTVLSRLLEPEEARRGRADLAEIVRGVRWLNVMGPFEARWCYYRLARALQPHEYRKLVAFGPAWFLHVNWSDPIPELGVSERIWSLSGDFVGPWPSHKAAVQALEGLWDLFDLCRHPEQVRKAPRGTRCAYAEMGRCDAPCDGGVPLAAYVDRCRAAWRFCTGRTTDWITDAATKMKAAATERQYEIAALIKKQLEFADRWQKEWSVIVRPATELNFLLAFPVTRRKAWKLMLFRLGSLADGPVLPRRDFAAKAAEWAMAEWERVTEPVDEQVRMEQTWLLCHLLFSREAERTIVLPMTRPQERTALHEMLAERLRALASAGKDSAAANASTE